MPSIELFTEAANEWDLETLYTDLASAKGKRLTPVEKLHLRGLLCGYSPSELAEKLNKSAKGIGVDLCNTLYHYVKNLVGKSDEKIENWRNITEWLEEAGYKSHSSAENGTSDCLPLEFLIKRANITIDKHKVLVDINLRIVASSPLETLQKIEKIDTNGKV
jgi:uncharacterized protein (UPF0210 family)